jgi:hypothetical protein
MHQQAIIGQWLAQSIAMLAMSMMHDDGNISSGKCNVALFCNLVWESCIIWQPTVAEYGNFQKLKSAFNENEWQFYFM